MMHREGYLEDLSDSEWKLVEPMLSRSPKQRGAFGKHSKREMLNAIFYVLRAGCAWRHLPNDFPPWQAVYSQFRRWRLSGLFQSMAILLKVPHQKIIKIQSV